MENNAIKLPMEEPEIDDDAFCETASPSATIIRADGVMRNAGGKEIGRGPVELIIPHDPLQTE